MSRGKTASYQGVFQWDQTGPWQWRAKFSVSTEWVSMLKRCGLLEQGNYTQKRPKSLESQANNGELRIQNPDKPSTQCFATQKQAAVARHYMRKVLQSKLTPGDKPPFTRKRKADTTSAPRQVRPRREQEQPQPLLQEQPQPQPQQPVNSREVRSYEPITIL